MLISCSQTEPVISSSTRTQTKVPLGGTGMNRVSTPPVTIPKLAPMSDSVGAPVPSFATICHRVWVPRWNRTRSAEAEKRALSDLLADARNTAKALRD